MSPIFDHPVRRRRHGDIDSLDAEYLASLVAARREFQGRRKGGDVFPIDLVFGELPAESGQAQFVGTVRDITERKSIEPRLRQAQKLEAIGQLAGGVAHDFNNITGSNMGFATMLVQDLAAGTPQRRFAERIAQAGQRARDPVQQILSFSRRASVAREPTDLAQLALETRDLLHGPLPATTKLEVIVESGGLVADADPGQLNQVLMNLCINANDALAGQSGTITLRLARVGPDDADHEAFDGAGKGGGTAGFGDDEYLVAGTLDRTLRYARITVADTGGGMGVEVLKRIFDPFFTTKKPGRGTGLGLSVVHGIVIGHDGACIATSRPGAGSTFTVYLPLSDAAAAPDALAPRAGEA